MKDVLVHNQHMAHLLFRDIGAVMTCFSSEAHIKKRAGAPLSNTVPVHLTPEFG
jgi:hypothetical protein